MQLFERDLGLPQQRMESRRQMLAECGASLFSLAAVQLKE